MKKLLVLSVLVSAGFAHAATTCQLNPLGVVDKLICINTESAASVAWGAVTGTLSDQTDLQAALDVKVPFTIGSGEPSGVCITSEVYFDSTNDAFWVCNNTTWSPQLQYYKGSSAPTTCSSEYAGAIYVRTSNGAVYACDGSNYQAVGGSTGQVRGYQTLTSGTSVTVTASTNNAFLLTLGHNVGTTTFSSPGTGQVYTFRICQPGSGGPYTFAWPTGFTLAGTIQTAASGCSNQSFWWNGSAAIPIGPIYDTDVTGSAIVMAGSSSGTTTLQPSAAASGTLTLPAATDTLVGKATTDTMTNKTLTTPTIGSFANANHNHADSAGGGQLGVTAVSATGTPSSSTYWRGDNTWATPSGGSSTWHYEWPQLVVWQNSSRYANVSFSATLVPGDGGGNSAGNIPFPNSEATSNDGLLLGVPLSAGYVTNGSSTLKVTGYAGTTGNQVDLEVEGRCVVPGSSDPSFASVGTLSVSVTGAYPTQLQATGTITINCAANQILELFVSRSQSDTNTGTFYAKWAHITQ